MARTSSELTNEEILIVWQLESVANSTDIIKDSSWQIDWLLHKRDATTAPTADDDSWDWYAVWSRWIDTTADKEYVCLDATATAAVWTETTITKPTESFVVATSDESTALTTWTAKVTFRMPYAFTVTEVRASLTWAWSTSWTTTVDINESGTTILSTKLTIDFWEKTSETAATAPVISDSSLADDAEITIDIDAVTWGADETGLKVYIIWNRT